MASNKYWAKRVRQRMDDYHKDNDRVIGKILEAYQGSIDDVSSEMSKIFKTYASTSKLTPEEAKQYLSVIENKQFIDNLRKTVDNITDENLRTEILRQINAPAYRARLTRLQAMKEKLNIECKKLADIQVREIEKGLIDTAHTSYYRTMFDMQQRTGLGFSFAEIPANQIEEILKNNWSGKLFSERVWNNTNVLASELEFTLTKGFMNGASIQNMAKAIADKMKVGEYAATRLVRTETTYVANMGELSAYKEAEVDKIMFLATLDTRTSDICRKHDESIVEVNKAVPGKNIPPLHANCRSSTIEIFEDDNLAELKRRSRDPVTGENKTVSANMKYDDWYNDNVANNPKAITEQKKVKNKAADRNQYERFKGILGNGIPKSFDIFQDMKYNNKEEWKLTKYNYKLRNEVKNSPDSVLVKSNELIINIRKYTNYLFGGENLDGLAKGKAFKSRLGYSIDNYMELDNLIKANIQKYPAILKGNTIHGDKYEVNMVLTGLTGKQAKVKAGIIVDENGPRLTTVFIDKLKESDLKNA